MIVKPNEIDKSGLNLNINLIQEFPPVFTGDLSYWGKQWEGNYSKLENLINDSIIDNYPKFKSI